MDNEQHELAGAHALNALDKEEREAFEAQVQDSEATRKELDGYEETAAMLALGVEPVAPPQRVKDNVMAAIRAKREAQAEPTVAEPTHAEPAHTGAPAATASGEFASHTPTRHPSRENVVDLHGERQRRAAGPRTVRWLAAAAGVLLVATGGLAGVVATQNSEQQRLQEQLATVSNDQAELARLFAAADLKSAGQQMQGGAVVNLAYAPSQGMMAVSAHGLPDLPEDKAYELWLISPEGATPAGMMAPDEAVAGAMRMVTGEMAGVTHFGITVEPASGSPAPTTEPIMLQEL